MTQRQCPWWRQLLQLNLLLALAGGSVSAAAGWLSAGRVSWVGAAVSVAVVLVVYNFDRLVDDSPLEGHSSPLRAATVGMHARWLKRSLGPLGLVALAVAGSRGLAAVAWTLCIPIAGAIYVLPVVPLGPWRRAKDIPYLKCFYVGASLSGGFVGIGVAFAGGTVDLPLLAFGVLVAARFFAGTYLGDLRDLQDDAAAGTATLAARLGHRRSHAMLRGVHLGSATGVLLGVATGLFPPGMAALLPAMAIAAAFGQAYARGPRDPELVLELYDLELLAFGPLVVLLT